jgi:beta-hydroxyacyl-ACP dehydratase FabZ
MLGIREIMDILPHRYPMLLVDRVIEIDAEKGKIVCLKNVTANEEFFLGHFPGAPVMPGVLIVEAMAQCAAVLILRDIPNRNEKLFLFGGVDKARFRKPVVPGDQLHLTCEIIQRRSSSVRVKGTATVDGNVVAEAELLSIMTDRPK